MATILETLITNAFTIIPLGAIVWIICRSIKRPAIAHGLWVLLLIKLLMPSFVQIPLPFATTIPNIVSDLLRNDTLVGTVIVADDSDAADGQNTTAFSTPADAAIAADSIAAQTGNETAGSSWTTESILRTLLFVWLAGSIAYLTMMIYRQIRFMLFLRANEEVDVDLIGEGYNLAWKMGLQNPPKVRILRGTLSPMLCGFGRAVTLIIPAELSDRLSKESRATLITHELAHFHRRDHWVRLLEGVVTGVFWWHPCVWFIRKQIEAVEEECVDARVVAEFPEHPRQYAEALLDTLDFLCERKVVLPPMASGLGTAPLLRRRLKQIMADEAPTQKVVTRKGACCLLLVAAMILPAQAIRFPAVISPEDAETSDALATAADETPAIKRISAGERGYRVIDPSGDLTLVQNETGLTQVQFTNSDKAFNLPPMKINCAVFTKGQRLVIGTDSGALKVIDCNTQKSTTTYRFSGPIRSIDWSEPEESLVVAAPGSLYVLRDSDFSAIARRRFSETINSVRFSRHGNRIVVTTADPDGRFVSDVDDAIGSVLVLKTADLYTADLFEVTRPTTMARFSRDTQEVMTFEPTGQVTTMTPGPLTAVATHWLPEKALSAIAFSSQIDDTHIALESF